MRSASTSAYSLSITSVDNLDSCQNLLSLVKTSVIRECVQGESEGRGITAGSHSESEVGLNLAVRNDELCRHVNTVSITEQSRSL